MKKKAIVVDIDNTISDTTHRDHLVNGIIKEWQRFFSEAGIDKPLSYNIDFIKSIYFAYRFKYPDLHLIFATGRPESIRPITQIWLDTYIKLPYTLIMRPDQHWVENHIFKVDAVKEVKNYYDIILFIDDNHKACEAVKEFLPVTAQALTIS